MTTEALPSSPGRKNPDVSDLRTQVIYDLTDDDLYEKIRTRLSTVPREQWPDPEFYDDMLLSANLRSMELGEMEADSAKSAESPTMSNNLGRFARWANTDPAISAALEQLACAVLACQDAVERRAHQAKGASRKVTHHRKQQ
jgi:hypothetical protein